MREVTFKEFQKLMANAGEKARRVPGDERSE
jgi:hypothetical protein